jgi:hypothetical protein
MHPFGGRRFVGAAEFLFEIGCDKAQPSESPANSQKRSVEP